MHSKQRNESMKEFLKLVKSLSHCGAGEEKKLKAWGHYGPKTPYLLSYCCLARFAAWVRLHRLAAVKTVLPYIRSKIVT